MDFNLGWRLEVLHAGDIGTTRPVKAAPDRQTEPRRPAETEIWLHDMSELPSIPSEAEDVGGPLQDSAADQAAWRAFIYELDAWRTAGMTARFWWRDDDAVDVVPQLKRLRALSERVAVPVALAVVPVHATAALAEFLADWPLAMVLQHGYDHGNRAPAGAKKTELSSARPVAPMLSDIRHGASLLQSLFGDRALPVLVPPWNRISPALVAALPNLSLGGLSTYRNRKSAPNGIVEVNTHVDIVNWDSRLFLGQRSVLDALVNHLRGLRLGNTEDKNDPTGILTHHWAHDEAAWAFLERFLTTAKAHPAVHWLDAATAFGLSGGPSGVADPAMAKAAVP